MICLMTPTGFRHKQFTRLENIVAQQTVKLPWVVVDDSPEPVTCTMGQTLLTPKHTIPGSTLGVNMLTFLDEIQPTGFIILEDDVYYKPNYIESILKLIQLADLVGFAPAYVYCVNQQKWLILKSKSHASWSETAIKGKAITALRTGLTRWGWTTKLDFNMWRSSPKRKDRYSKFLAQLKEPMAVSMKGEGQARALGSFHDGERMHPDSDLTVLTEWLGKDVGLYYENTDTIKPMELPPDSICNGPGD